MSLDQMPERSAAPEASFRTYEELSEEGFEYTKSETYASAQEAREALDAFEKTNFAKLYDRSSFVIARYESKFVVMGKKVVVSPLKKRQR